MPVTCSRTCSPSNPPVVLSGPQNLGRQDLKFRVQEPKFGMGGGRGLDSDIGGWGGWDPILGVSGGGRKMEGLEPQNLDSGPKNLGQDTKLEDMVWTPNWEAEIWGDWEGQHLKIWGVQTQNSGFQSSNLGNWGAWLQTPGKRTHFEMKILFLVRVLREQIGERCVYSIN